MTAKNKKIVWLGFVIIIILIILFIVLRNKPTNEVADTSPFVDANGRLAVITTLFPVYDFAKVVGGDKASVSLILPEGSEAHAYRPTAEDKEIIKQSAIFFYTSDLMEPWAPDLAGSLSPRTKMLAVADGLNNETLDPHVWLDFSKASLMVDDILAEYKLVDPANATYYEQNATQYKQELSKLDADYVAGLKDCNFHEFISGGHFAFGYLAKRYNLKYQAVQGFAPDDSLDTDKVLRLSKELKDTKQPYVYYEELIMPYLAELMRQSSGANLMPLNAAHNISAYDIESGITFIGLMESDLTILRKGLICR